MDSLISFSRRITSKFLRSYFRKSYKCNTVDNYRTFSTSSSTVSITNNDAFNGDAIVNLKYVKTASASDSIQIDSECVNGYEASEVSYRNSIMHNSSSKFNHSVVSVTKNLNSYSTSDRIFKDQLYLLAEKNNYLEIIQFLATKINYDDTDIGNRKIQVFISNDNFARGIRVLRQSIEGLNTDTSTNIIEISDLLIKILEVFCFKLDENSNSFRTIWDAIWICQNLISEIHKLTDSENSIRTSRTTLVLTTLLSELRVRKPRSAQDVINAVEVLSALKKTEVIQDTDIIYDTLKMIMQQHNSIQQNKNVKANDEVRIFKNN